MLEAHIALHCGNVRRRILFRHFFLFFQHAEDASHGRKGRLHLCRKLRDCLLYTSRILQAAQELGEDIGEQAARRFQQHYRRFQYEAQLSDEMRALLDLSLIHISSIFQISPFGPRPELGGSMMMAW